MKELQVFRWHLRKIEGIKLVSKGYHPITSPLKAAGADRSICSVSS